MPSTGDIFQIQRYKKVESILYFHSLLPSSNTFFIQSLWLEITYQLSITLRNNKINPNFLCHVQSPTSLDHQVGLQIRSISITWGLLRNAHLGPHPRRKKKGKGLAEHRTETEAKAFSSRSWSLVQRWESKSSWASFSWAVPGEDWRGSSPTFFPALKFCVKERERLMPTREEVFLTWFDPILPQHGDKNHC